MTNKIDIKDIGDKKMQTYDTAEMSDLDEYLVIAEKTISSYAPKIKQGLAEEMLRSEDAVANIAHSIMVADWQFNGIGSRYGFRKDRAQFAIRNYLSRRAKDFKKRTFSLDGKIDFNKSTDSFGDMMESYYDSPIAKIEAQELIDNIFEKIEDLSNQEIISSLAASYLRLYYIDGLSLQDIANTRKVSRQSVQDLLSRTIKVLKRVFSSEDG